MNLDKLNHQLVCSTLTANPHSITDSSCNLLNNGIADSIQCAAVVENRFTKNKNQILCFPARKSLFVARQDKEVIL